MTEGAVVWFTGLPSSGKSTLARAAAERLRKRGIACCLLDGDAVRDALLPRPGYEREERDRFYATLGNLAALLEEQGLVVLVAATAHRREHREKARASARRFFEVWVDVPIEECRRRDAKGLYAAFAAGRLRAVPGEDEAYEAPLGADVVAQSGGDERTLDLVLALLAAH